MRTVVLVFYSGILLLTGCATNQPTASDNTSIPAYNWNTCAFKFDADPTPNLCKWYWDDTFASCNGTIRDVLTSRGLEFKKSICGTLTSAARNSQPPVQATPQSPTQASCGLGDLQAFTSQATAALCTVAHGGGSCSQLARLSLQGQGMLVGNSLNSCGSPAKNECAALVERFKSFPNPVSAACAVRSDKSSLAGLNCRSAIAGFLLNFRKSSGLSGNQCGQPLSSQELEIHKK